MNELTTKPAFADGQPHRLTADDYLCLIESNAFGDDHVELVDGVLVRMSPSQSEHGRLLMLLGRLLGNACEGTGFTLYGDIITLFDKHNVRAPDIALVDRDIGGRKELVPSDILLAVEIAGSSIRSDLGRKLSDYAEAKIRNYWVVDIEKRLTHCFSDPQGAVYASGAKVSFGETMTVPGGTEMITIA